MRNLLNILDKDIIVFDKSGRAIFCTDNLLKKVGYTLTEFLESNNVIDITDIDFIHNTPRNHKFFLTTNKGYNLEIEGKIVKDEWQREEALYFLVNKYNKGKLSNELAMSILDKIPNLIWIKTCDGKFVYMNDATKKISCLRDEDYLGKTSDVLFPSEVNEVLDENEKIILQYKTSIALEYKLKSKGNLRWLQIDMVPILDSEGNIKYIESIAKDMTIIKELQGKINSIQTNMKNTDLENVNLDAIKRISNNILEALNIGCFSVNIYDDAISDNFVYGSKNGKDTELQEALKIEYRTMKQLENLKCINNILEIKQDMPIPNTNILLEKGFKYIGIYQIKFMEKVYGVFTIALDNIYNLENKHLIYSIIALIGGLSSVISFRDTLSCELKKRKQIEEELESMIEVAADVVLIGDYNGNIKRIGLGTKGTLQWNVNDVINTNWKKYVHPDDYKKIYDDILEGKYNKELTKNEARILAKDGTYRTLAWRGNYIQERDLFVATGTDITEDKKLEEAKRRYEAARKEETMKNDFFANMSHEFKTPLNIILSTLQLIKYNMNNKLINVTPNDKFNKYLKSIEQNSYRLLRLANNIIDMSKIDAGYYNIKLENRNIVEVVEELVDSVADYIKYKNMDIVFDTEVEEMIVACDPIKIERILLNLISNSIKYTERDGKVEVHIYITDNVIISVKDNGIGIPEDQIKEIFNRFKQVDNTFTRKTEGTGIGLSIAKALVELHGGKIWAKSKLGQGSEFLFSIPIRVVRKEKVELNHNHYREKPIIEFADIM